MVIQPRSILSHIIMYLGKSITKLLLSPIYDICGFLNMPLHSPFQCFKACCLSFQNVFKLLNFKEFLILIEKDFLQLLLMLYPKQLDGLEVSGSLQLHLSNFPEELFEPIFLLVWFVEIVLDKSHSGLKFTKKLLVDQELLLVFDALLHHWGHKVLHCLSHFGFKY